MNTAKPSRRQQRAQRRALRRKLRSTRRLARAQQRAALRQARRTQRAQHPTKQRARRRAWTIAAVLVALLILMLTDCSCAGKAYIRPDKPSGSVPPLPSAAAPASTPPNGTLPPQTRRTYTNPELQPLPWLADFRLQVAARSPALARCMVDSPHPGVLKWTVSVTPASGQVSDHLLEPMQQTEPLGRAQQDCIFAALQSPPYQLPQTTSRETPSRISLIIEF